MLPDWKTTPSSGIHIAWAAIAGLAGLVALLLARKRLRGTTLLAPWWWCVVSLGAVVAVEIVLGTSEEVGVVRWSPAARYAAAVTMFGPIMAVLGAKRPQDRAWQFIVLSLLAVLALPSGEAILFRGGEGLSLHAARLLFLAALLVVGLANYLPTRYALPAIVFAAGQSLLLSAYIPWLEWLHGPQSSLWGLTLISLAGPVALVCRSDSSNSAPLDRLWIDFRNAFGAVWALRIAERINASAKMYGWNVWLTWHGFVQPQADQRSSSEEPGHLALSPEVDDAIRKSLKTLLRRFVSSEWIEERLTSVHVAAQEKPPVD
jgi:hypothetical protein